MFSQKKLIRFRIPLRQFFFYRNHEARALRLISVIVEAVRGAVFVDEACLRVDEQD